MRETKANSISHSLQFCCFSKEPKRKQVFLQQQLQRTSWDSVSVYIDEDIQSATLTTCSRSRSGVGSGANTPQSSSPLQQRGDSPPPPSAHHVFGLNVPCAFPNILVPACLIYRDSNLLLDPWFR